MPADTEKEIRLDIALTSIKRQLTRTLRNNLNTHAISFPKGIKYISVNDDEPASQEVREFLSDLKEFLDDKGKAAVDKVVERDMEVNRDILHKITETVLQETFRVDDAADVMRFDGADHYLNRLYDMLCKHNRYSHDSAEFKLWQLVNEQSDSLRLPAMWEKTKFTLKPYKKTTLPENSPTVIILPGLTTSNPALIGSTDPDNPDESIPLASVITRHIALSGVPLGNAKNPQHNINVLFLTHGDDYAKLQAWFDITRHNEDIKAGKPPDEIYVTPRVTAFVQEHMRPLYVKNGEKLPFDQIKKNLSNLLFVGYSAGTSTSSMIALALGRDMRKMNFTQKEADALLPYLHVLNTATVSNPLALQAAPTTLSIQNETDRYAPLSQFEHSFPAAEADKDVRTVYTGEHHLLMQPKDPGDCYPSYIISADGSSRKLRYREDDEKHNAPSLLARPIIQVNGEGAELRPPVENPGSMLSHFFITDWHIRATEPHPEKSEPQEILAMVRTQAGKFSYSWLDKVRQSTLPKKDDMSEPSPHR